MKKDLFSIVAAVLPDSKNIRIQNNTYTDSYFNTGFTCPGVFVGFNFFSDADRADYKKVIKSLERKRNLTIDVIKNNGYAAGFAVWFSSDYPVLSWIEEEKHKAVEKYWENDHDLRVKGFSDDARATIMRGIHFENVAAFLAKYSKVYKIA